METYGWLLDPKKCIECRACEAACKQWNHVETGVGTRYRKVQIYEAGAYPAVGMQALSIACNHCENAFCIKACPVKAIWRRDEDGAVLIDREKCVACRQCQVFCPYHAPQFNERTKKMEKCTMCFDRLDAGLKPACATLCPTGALQFGPWKEIASQGSAEIDNFPTPNTTRPRIRFITEPFSGK